jgi:hypothetical protein
MHSERLTWVGSVGDSAATSPLLSFGGEGVGRYMNE